MTATEPIVKPRMIVRSDALQQGMSADDIERKRQRGEWVGLRAGVYVSADELARLDQRRRHLMLVEATVPRLPLDAVLSHSSAACLHGFNLLRPDLRAVQLTRPGRGGGHKRRSLHTFRADITDDEVVIVDGYRVTSPARTVLDLGRHLTFDAGTVAADCALSRQATSVDALLEAAAQAPRRPGMCRALEVVRFADGRSESVGESLSRVVMKRGGLPPPELQFKVRNAGGKVVARTDFAWEEFRTIGEFDGAEKYGRLLRPGVKPGDIIYREKLREDLIRDLGWQVVRWTWEELEDAQAFFDKISRALARGARTSS